MHVRGIPRRLVIIYCLGVQVRMVVLDYSSSLLVWCIAFLSYYIEATNTLMSLSTFDALLPYIHLSLHSSHYFNLTH